MNRRSGEDHLLKESEPNLGVAAEFGSAEANGNHKLINTYDLVEPMHYLYVRIVEAKDLSAKDGVSVDRSLFRFRRSRKEVTVSSCDPYVVVKQGNYRGVSKVCEKNLNPKWNVVFAFGESQIQDSEIEVGIMDKGSPVDVFRGRVLFGIDKVPKRVPPDIPLSPQWYGLEDRKGEKVDGELMLAIWWGTQADEAFPEAWLSDAAGANCRADLESKLYISPKLWYLRVNLIEAQDLFLSKVSKSSETFVKATIGFQAFSSSPSPSKSINPVWNEDFMFVVAEPFEEALVLNVMERVSPKKDVVLGRCVIPLKYAKNRLMDFEDVKTRWFKLEKDVVEGENIEDKFASRIHVRFGLEGGYHVQDESDHNCSDYRPADEKLWKSSIGVLEVGILMAKELSPLKTKHGRATTDAYCVAKYGQEWARTRTICDSLSPKWNEQYAWKVFDPCTVLTIGVFDNGHFQGRDKDSIIGKVRIRVSTLERGNVYTHSYPLLVLHLSGVKKMGEIQLAVRFTYHSMVTVMQSYSQQLLPEKHYIHPLSCKQLDILRFHASRLISNELSLAEPPLKKEVVQYILDEDSNLWSFRKSKANYLRSVAVLSGFSAVWQWLDDICNWKNPMMTILIHIFFVVLVWYPQLIFPSIFLYLFLGRVWYYRWRPVYPPHMDTHISCLDDVHPDELDEELDTFPTSRPGDIVRMRYDRMRSIGGKMQMVVGDLATEGERIQSLLGWTDPRLTTLFTMFCFAAAIVLYHTPFQVVALLTGLYILRHPRFRSKGPSVLLNIFRRLPARTDCML